MNKFSAKPTLYKGVRYDSRAEAAYAQQLDWMVAARKVDHWMRGERVILIHGETRATTVTYRPDFVVYYPDGTREAVDVKGVLQRETRVKLLLWRQMFPNLPVVLIRNGERVDPFPKRTATPARKPKRGKA